jgi:hypothetical protein
MGTEYSASIQIRDKGHCIPGYEFRRHLEKGTDGTMYLVTEYGLPTQGLQRTNHWRNVARFYLGKDVFAWSNNASCKLLDLKSDHGYDLDFCYDADLEPEQCMSSTYELQPANLSPEISSFPY